MTIQTIMVPFEIFQTYKNAIKKKSTQVAPLIMFLPKKMHKIM